MSKAKFQKQQAEREAVVAKSFAELGAVVAPELQHDTDGIAAAVLAEFDYVLGPAERIRELETDARALMAESKRIMDSQPMRDEAEYARLNKDALAEIEACAAALETQTKANPAIKNALTTIFSAGVKDAFFKKIKAEAEAKALVICAEAAGIHDECVAKLSELSGLNGKLRTEADRLGAEAREKFAEAKKLRVEHHLAKQAA